ncbi:MAG: chorismate-binding protein [bacterium]
MDPIATKAITLEKLHRLALDNDIAFATYRVPGKTGPVTLLQWTSNPLRFFDISQLKGQKGFVFAPFDQKSGPPIRIIQPDLIVEGDNFSEPQNRNIIPEENGQSSAKNLFMAMTNNYIADKEEFMEQVKKIKAIISAHTISKLVLSRTHREEKPASFHSAAFFQSLDKAYPEAFVFAVYIPDTGLWLGATPEPLLLIQDRKATTVSLAGTRKRESQTNNQQPWGGKELDEQLIVTRYIEDLLQKRNITGFEKKGPDTFPAGSVEHLKTTFTFPLEELENQTVEFLKELHPTPSVCGLPKDVSIELISGMEKHRREYYSGFLGPMNMNGEWDIYVNLRSMKAVGKKLEYYMGAGITAGSEPEKEWEETLNKMNTLKSVVESLKEN